MELAICEIFNPHMHGQNDDSSPGITSHFLVHSAIDLEEFYDLSFTDIIRMLRDGYHAYLAVWGDRMEHHPIVRNYENIIRGNSYIKLDIVVLDELEGYEAVGYMKTHWIRLIQRRWKTVFKERKRIIQARARPSSMRYRETHGCWPKGLGTLPAFRLGLHR